MLRSILGQVHQAYVANDEDTPSTGNGSSESEDESDRSSHEENWRTRMDRRATKGSFSMGWACGSKRRWLLIKESLTVDPRGDAKSRRAEVSMG
eukprot:1686351-Karenia_brevis.AAC.1